MNAAKDQVQELALDISSCTEVSSAFASEGHPCHKVATWQKGRVPGTAELTSPSGSRIQRPEPWTGNLRKAPIIFLASNPSFDEKEFYPDWSGDWTEQDIIQFGSERFLASPTRPFGATDGPSLKDQDRTYLRNGKLSRAVAHWRRVRALAALFLEKSMSEVSAHDDYVMTELVHCKSWNEVGVPQALSHCTQLWMERVFSLSPANLIVVLGSKPAKMLCQAYPQIPENWGVFDGRGQWPKSWIDLQVRKTRGSWGVQQQQAHTTKLMLGGRMRTLVWLPRGGSSMPQKIENSSLVDPSLLNEWRTQARDL